MRPSLAVFVMLAGLAQCMNVNRPVRGVDKTATTSDESDLRSVLFKNYDKSLLPTGATVQAGYEPTCVMYNQETRVLESVVWERYYWRDERLTWRPARWENIQEIRVAPWLIWVPDLTVYNTLEPYIDRSWNDVVLTSDGYVSWSVIAKYKTPCKDAKCRIRIESWSYDGTKLRLELNENGLDLSAYNADCPWSISNANIALNEIKYECCDEPYPTIDLSFDVAQSS